MTDVRLSDLVSPPEAANPHWFQQRGRAFERVINQILAREDMEPRSSMRPSGEEIDGSFAIADCFFLLEAKWQANPIPASSLYAFKGKVDGKLVGTLGIFISMSDYSADAVDALLTGKELNLILFGQKDLLLIEDGKMTMREAIRVKRRYASEYGQPFFALESYLAEHSSSIVDYPFSKSPREWVIVVESVDDARTIEILFSRFETASKIMVFPAGGQLSVAPLVKYLRKVGKKHVAAIVTPSTETLPHQKHLDELKTSGAELIMLRSTMEDWLGYFVPVDLYNACIMGSDRNGKMARRFARHADLKQLLNQTPSFSALINKLEARLSER